MGPKGQLGRDPRSGWPGVRQSTSPAICLAFLVLAALFRPGPAAAQDAPFCPPGQVPQFQAGLAALRAELGQRMGDPTECAHSGAGPGDTFQQTTRGLALYRASTGIPVFIAGSQYWALTAGGLVFWIQGTFDPPAGAEPWPGCGLRREDITLDQTTVDPDGRAHFAGIVRNGCRVALEAEFRFALLDAATGQRMAVAPTVYVGELQPGQVRRFSGWLEGMDSAGAYRREWGWEWWRLAERTGGVCLDVGASQCLVVEPRLSGTVARLGETSAGPDLLRAAAEAGVTIERAGLDREKLGAFVPGERRVLLSTRLDQYSAWERAATLAHELQHVADWVEQGDELPTPDHCLETEARAFAMETATWSELWGGQMPLPGNPIQERLNDLVGRLAADPETFRQVLAERYAEECAE